ncbi:MAG: sensor histidine kinase [Polyangiaceae bacterium]|nr:sensor histidine kinase [Polyangiaceae bacterium]MCB9608239.1 sensor histidine kinase [Polyangiaceae bacterium]
MTFGSIGDYMSPLSEASPLATLADVEPALRQGSPAFFREGQSWRGVVAEMVAGQPRSRRLIDLPSLEVVAAHPDLDPSELLRLADPAFAFTPIVRGEQLVGVVDRRRLAVSLDDEAFQTALSAVEGTRVTVLGLLHDMANLVTVLQAEDLGPRVGSSMEHLGLLVHRMRALQLGYDLQSTEIEIGHILQRSRPLLELQAGPTLTLVIEPSQREMKVRCVPGLVTRCLANLVSNSKDAIQGTGCITLRSGLSSDLRMVFAEVADDGPGVPEALRSQIFERGFSTKKGQHWGLGLYALRRAARRNGGDLKLQSGEPGNCCFRLELPRAEEPV